MKAKLKSLGQPALLGFTTAFLLATTLQGGENPTPKPDGFRTAEVTPETNRKATVDAAKFIDPTKPDCGIQAAIDALPPQGGEVILPEGNFVVKKALVLRSGVRLRGQGAKTQIAQPSPLVQTKLANPMREGDTELVVEDATGFTPGMEISGGFRGKLISFFMKISPKSREFWIAYDRIFVVAVKDNTIQISAPFPGNLKTLEVGDFITNFFPVIYAINVSDIEVRDLEIVGGDDDPAADIGQFRINGDYTASALTFFYVDRVRICNVTVRGWKGDGFSLQGGNNNLLSECQALNMKGSETKGYHPGSVQNECILTRSLADGCEGPGIFFCHEVKFSVVGNSILTNNGEMIGGFSDDADMFNVCNRNYGENNKKGLLLTEGSDQVFAENVIVNTAAAPVEFSGNTRKPDEPNMWPCYQVVASNTIVNQGETADVEPLILIRPGTSASVIANNAFQSANDAMAVKDDAPDLNVVANNHPLEGPYAKPVVPKIPPALPAITVDAATFYDPKKPDCGFQAAIDKAAKDGGRVQLPAGVYALSQGLSLPSGVTLAGAGTVTVLLWKGTGPAIASKDQSQIAIRQLSIRQSPDNTQPTQAIAITGGTGVLIDSVIVDDMTGPGIQLKGTKDTLISQSLVSGCEAGYVCEKAMNLTIAESWSLRHKGDGIHIADSSGEVVIDSSIVSGNRGYGVAVQEPRDGAFSLVSSVITESGKNGLFLQDCAGGTVRGNIVHRGRVSEFENFPPAAAVLLAGTTRDIRITENRIVENRTAERSEQAASLIAVEEEATASGNTIRFNVLCSDKYTGELLALSGKNTVAKDNILKPHGFKYPPAGATAQ